MQKKWHSMAALAALSAFLVTLSATPSAETALGTGRAYAQSEADQDPELNEEEPEEDERARRRREREERQRAQQERAEQEQAEREAERAARQAEQERERAEREAERAAREAERAERERAEREERERERAAQEAEREQAERERAEREERERERAAQEAEQEQAERERAEREERERERAAQEAEREERERERAEQETEQERAERERAEREAEREADQAERERERAEREAEREAEQAERERERAEREAERAGQEQDAGEADEGEADEGEPDGLAQRMARKFIDEAGPASGLSDEELRRRIERAERLAANEDVGRRMRRALRDLVESDRAELDRRLAGAAPEEPALDEERQRADETEQEDRERADEAEREDRQGADETEREDRQRADDAERPPEEQMSRQVREILDDERPPSELGDRALRRRVEAITSALEEPDLPRRQEQLLRERLRADREEFEARTADRGDEATERVSQNVREILDDDRPASELGRRELRRRIGDIRAALEETGLPDREERQLREMLRADQAELETRTAERDEEPSERMSRQVREILADDRPASELRDRELRDRVEEIRLALQATDLPDRDWQRLRERLDVYREELRYRVARSEGRERERDEARDLDEYWDIVGDRRRSEELSRQELRLRIEAVLVLLERGDLSDRRRDRLRVMLRDDREELREWRQARREERRRYLREERRQGEFNIIIGGGYADDYYDYYDTEGHYDYPVAEMDDEDLMRHLTAPPREPIEDRYAADELDDHPEIREMMPGVEVDTITFGFNEYQVGPEQIEELERLGLALEEILAEHADEVFAVEGHTDAVGSDAYNQRLSEQRAEAVKEALVEYFVIDPQNLITIGYGERYLRIPTEEEERENRRVSIRRVTPWLVGEAD